MSIFAFGRLNKKSRGNVAFGFILAIAAVFMLFLNEGRAVKRYQDLKEGAGTVITVAADKVDPSNDKKLVHLTGKTTTAAPVVDAEFGISETAIKLIRKTEMYQWVESSSNTRTSSNDKEREVVYKKKWRSDLVDSSVFIQKEGRLNPAQIKHKSTTALAKAVKLGAFTLPDFLIEKINNADDYSVAALDRASPEIKRTGQLRAGGVYFGKDPAAPAIGDIRVQFSIVRPGAISAVAQQMGSTFAKYNAKTGGTVELLEIGEHASEAMFQMAQDRNKVLTWGIRAGGFFMLASGFSLLLGPLAAIASIVPFLGNIVGAGTKMIGFLLAAIVWTLTVGTAWIFYRPVLGIALLVVTVVLLVVVIKKLAKRKQDQPAPVGPSNSSPPPFSP